MIKYRRKSESSVPVDVTARYADGSCIDIYIDHVHVGWFSQDGILRLMYLKQMAVDTLLAKGFKVENNTIVVQG